MAQEIDLDDLCNFLGANDVTETLIVLRRGEKYAVVVPYELFMANQRANRQVLVAGKMTPEDLQAITESPIPDDLGQFDDEVK